MIWNMHGLKNCNCLALLEERYEKNVVTGGSGNAGHAVIRDLVAHGYVVLNIDVNPPPDTSVRFLKIDLTDFGQTVETLKDSDADYVVATEGGKLIFISYSTIVSASADRLRSDLSAAGLNLWIDRIGLKVGAPDWEDAIR